MKNSLLLLLSISIFFISSCNKDDNDNISDMEIIEEGIGEPERTEKLMRYKINGEPVNVDINLDTRGVSNQIMWTSPNFNTDDDISFVFNDFQGVGLSEVTEEMVLDLKGNTFDVSSQEFTNVIIHIDVDGEDLSTEISEGNISGEHFLEVTNVYEDPQPNEQQLGIKNFRIDGNFNCIVDDYYTTYNITEGEFSLLYIISIE